MSSPSREEVSKLFLGGVACSRCGGVSLREETSIWPLNYETLAEHYPKETRAEWRKYSSQDLLELVGIWRPSARYLLCLRCSEPVRATFVFASEV